MTQYVSTIITNTVEVEDLDPSVVVTASGSIISSDFGIVSGVVASATVDGSVYAGDTGVSFANEGSSVTVSDLGLVYGEATGVALANGNILNNSGQIRSGSSGAHTQAVYLGGTDNYVINSG